MYLTHYMKNMIISTCDEYKNDEFIGTQSSESSVYVRVGPVSNATPLQGSPAPGASSSSIGRKDLTSGAGFRDVGTTDILCRLIPG